MVASILTVFLRLSISVNEVGADFALKTRKETGSSFQLSRLCKIRPHNFSIVELRSWPFELI